MDPLSDTIALLRPHTAISKPITGLGKWGVRYAAYGAPSFCIVLSGRCWLMMKGDTPRQLERGDFLLLFATPAFDLVSEPGAMCTTGYPSDKGVRHGEPEGAPDFEMLGGSFQIEQTNAALLDLLHEKIHIRAAKNDTIRLSRMIDLIRDEYTAERPGRDMILDRLLEVMLVEALRWPGLRQEFMPGLLAGMRDAPLAVALRAMHADVRRGWTIAELAKHAGMSRSAFAARFSVAVGCAPMEYLARWRMSLAQDALSRGDRSLDRVAEEIGYESASAFSTAFRKRLGCAPGAFKRARRNAEAA